MAGPRASDLFVGREREIAQLTAALGDSLAGHGRVVMLVGEPGIGKSRTAEEIASVSIQRGMEVLWGRCPEVSGVPPFWPWAQALRECIRRRTHKTMRRELGAGASDIAALVPQISERLAGLQPSPRLETAEAEQFRLFDSIVSFLKRASETTPLVLILDDLHWADASSLRLLEFAAHELAKTRLLILGTYRDADIVRGHPLFRSLGALAKFPTFQRMVLRGLEQQEVGELIAATGGQQPPERFTRWYM